MHVLPTYVRRNYVLKFKIVVCMKIAAVQRVSQVQNLGILFVPSLSISPHIDYMFYKAFRVLEFIKR